MKFKKKYKKRYKNMDTKEKMDNVEEVLKKAAEEAAAEAQVSEENNVNEPEAEVEVEAKVEADDKEAQLTEMQAALDDQKDKYLRLSAEFDNYRKRTLKEKAELIKNGGEKTLTAILPVLDDLERALKNIPDTEETKALKEGVELIATKFEKILEQEGLHKIETANQVFDTDYHEAIAMIPAPSEDMKGKILDCVQTGYMLNDKVIRHAKVAVAQ